MTRESVYVTTQLLITAVDQQSNQINGSSTDPSKTLSKNESMRRSLNEQPAEYQSTVKKTSPQRRESTSKHPCGEGTTTIMPASEDVNAEHYYLSNNFNDIMAELERVAKERESNNVVLKEIENMVASEPNGRALAIDIMGYINRRAMQDASQECYSNSRCLV